MRWAIKSSPQTTQALYAYSLSPCEIHRNCQVISHVSEAFRAQWHFYHMLISGGGPRLLWSSIFWPLNHGAYYSSVRAKHFLTTGRPAGTEQRAGGTRINIIIQPRSPQAPRPDSILGRGPPHAKVPRRGIKLLYGEAVNLWAGLGRYLLIVRMQEGEEGRKRNERRIRDIAARLSRVQTQIPQL